MTAPPTPLLDADQAAFMQGGVSISVAACSRSGMPSACRAMGCAVSADRSRVTVFVAATQATQLLADIRDNGAIAIVFSEPSTHRSVQVKGRSAEVAGATEADWRVIDAYREAFVRELAPMGYDELLIHALLSCAPADAVALRFTPSEAYLQTPGPGAGTPLEKGA